MFVKKFTLRAITQSLPTTRARQVGSCLNKPNQKIKQPQAQAVNYTTAGHVKLFFVTIYSATCLLLVHVHSAAPTYFAGWSLLRLTNEIRSIPVFTPTLVVFFS